MEEGEKIAALLAVKEWPAEENQQFVVMGTRKGAVKKTDLTAFSNPRAGGIIAIGVEEGDSVIAVRDDRRQRAGVHRHARRHGDPLRRDRRAADGPRRPTASAASRSARRDEVVAMEVVREGGTMLTVTQNGYGKRTELEEYREQSRGGVGIINIQTSDRNGKVVGIAYVHDDDELMLISQQGMILRMVAKDIRVDRPRDAGRPPAGRGGRRSGRLGRAPGGARGRERTADGSRRRPAPDVSRRSERLRLKAQCKTFDHILEDLLSPKPRALRRLELRVLRQQLLHADRREPHGDLRSSLCSSTAMTVPTPNCGWRTRMPVRKPIAD